MAFTHADLELIERAIVTRQASVRFSDGRQVTYRSIDELKAARATIQAELSRAGEANPAASRRGFATFRA